MKKILFFASLVVVGAGILLTVFIYFIKSENHFYKYSIVPDQQTGKQTENIDNVPVKEVEEIEESRKLENPPEEVRALYLTAWSASNSDKMDSYIDLIKKEKLNAVVIDIKDASGFIAYDIENEDVKKYGAKNVKIPQIDELLKKLHDNNIYAIARIVAFEDPIVAQKRPDLAIKNNSTGGLWENYNGIEWIDPAATEYWEYIVEIAQETSDRGFDEINFDYIRFPSDGPLSKMSFPFYDSKSKSKREAMKEVFEYLRLNLNDIKISVDFFGLVTINTDDLGIGQTIEDAFENFDYICPMVYPSHYAAGFIGYSNPAQYPYEVVKYSIEHATERLEIFRLAQEENSEGEKKPLAKIRPWLQAFDMGAVYGPGMVKKQIDASNESGGVGWFLWNAANNYETKVVGVNN